MHAFLPWKYQQMHHSVFSYEYKGSTMVSQVLSSHSSLSVGLFNYIVPLTLLVNITNSTDGNIKLLVSTKLNTRLHDNILVNKRVKITGGSLRKPRIRRHRAVSRVYCLTAF